MNLESLTLDIHLQIDVKASLEKTFAGLVHRLGEGNIRPDGVPMPMKLELFPGGRWFRDLGDNQGHLWGFVQSIKAPALLEFIGPCFMSYPVSGHIIIRLSQEGTGTRIDFRHRAFGLIDDNHRQGVVDGWNSYLQKVKDHSEQS